MKEKLPQVKTYVPEGTYALWLDFSDYGYTPETLQYICYQMANVFIQKGLSHDPGEGGMFMRMCVTTSKGIVKQAIDRLSGAFAQYESENK